MLFKRVSNGEYVFGHAEPLLELELGKILDFGNELFLFIADEDCVLLCLVSVNL